MMARGNSPPRETGSGRPTVAVVGGGIAGLAAANRLREQAPQVRVILLEAGSRLGGVIQTTCEDGYLFEGAADGFRTVPSSAAELSQRLGLADQLIGVEAGGRRALVLRQGRLWPVPSGFHLMAPGRLGAFLATPLLSWRGKLRAGMECVLPGRTDVEDESVQSFVCRRFGRELFARLVQPLVGSIYAADTQHLSIESTFPRFRQMEREHGSLLRGMFRAGRGKQPSACGARYAQFSTLRTGMSTLVTTLADHLPRNCLQLDSPVTELANVDGCWQLTIGGPRPSTIYTDGVVLATPAHLSACLLNRVDAELTEWLRAIPYASCAVVGLGYRRDQIAHRLDGAGFVVPLIEQRTILSCSFSSVKYGGRAPEGCVLLRAFVGGHCQSGLLKLSSNHLIELAEREVGDLLRIRGAPTLRRIVRHHRALPQYHVGHGSRVASIEARLRRWPSMAIAGSSLHGIGVPACIQSGESAADQIVTHLCAGKRRGTTLDTPSRQKEVIA